VDVSAFSNITGQIFYNRILEGWKNATLVSEQLTERVPTTLDGEKMPWLSHVISEGEPIHPGMPYPEANFGERYVTTPSTTKYGLIVSVTKEMIFFDRTGQSLRAAGETGFKLGYNKEKRVLNLVLGLINNYSLNGTTYNTYLTGPQSPPAYANSQASTPLVDYTSIQAAITLASQILDPDTGNPLDNIEMKHSDIRVPARQRRQRALRHGGCVRHIRDRLHHGRQRRPDLSGAVHDYDLRRRHSLDSRFDRGLSGPGRLSTSRSTPLQRVHGQLVLAHADRRTGHSRRRRAGIYLAHSATDVCRMASDGCRPARSDRRAGKASRGARPAYRRTARRACPVPGRSGRIAGKNRFLGIQE
jgi:hypothetical protein